MVGLTRANNVAIMLTQFADIKGGALEIRAAVLSGPPLSIERLSLLCQVPQHSLSMIHLFCSRLRFLHTPFILGRCRKNIACMLGRDTFHGCRAEYVKGGGEQACM